MIYEPGNGIRALIRGTAGEPWLVRQIPPGVRFAGIVGNFFPKTGAPEVNDAAELSTCWQIKSAAKVPNRPTPATNDQARVTKSGTLH